MHKLIVLPERRDCLLGRRVLLLINSLFAISYRFKNE